MATIISADEALKVIQSGDKIYVHSVAAAPQHLLQQLVRRSGDLQNVELYHLHTEGDAPYTRPEYEGIFHTNAFFIGKNIRKAIAEGRGSYIPVFLSEIPRLFRQNIIKLNVALISVSLPDKNGFCSLGTSLDATLAALESADVVIAQANKFVPRTWGNGQIHLSKIKYLVPFDEPLPTVTWSEPTEIEKQIGNNVASLVEDGATLQMGIGNIPNAVLAALGNHKDLGIHTEMFSDGLIPLIEKGVVTGRFKKKHPGKVVTTFLYGSEHLYKFVDDNPLISMLPVDYVNDTSIICQNPKVTAINSAIEIDITGQICADSIGYQMYSGVGGQMDFIRGAALSEGGKPIIALQSATKNGETKIVTHLKEGAGVVTTRGHVHYVVTEYGIAYIYGKNLVERAKELIKVAHPDHREQLEREAFERFRHQATQGTYTYM
ncbi:acetyl-CoA hydrolase/transferase family protein [Emticicia sp. TH156]|uniref:acetyl-CoA hydrolase/transferase family protein n=1 Tax=Emticicia sp. TH156 TaxID=2067454 RepID=UPI000C75CE35|nr:acetyl-CoA hydrolase/transferase C-terminal domain-containing protein [Emticicia sp. TH156]PLK45356.1 4-hydroxybutyrate CoA-transferase [Emticicia sp. TH156]